MTLRHWIKNMPPKTTYLVYTYGVATNKRHYIHRELQKRHLDADIYSVDTMPTAEWNQKFGKYKKLDEKEFNKVEIIVLERMIDDEKDD